MGTKGMSLTYVFVGFTGSNGTVEGHLYTNKQKSNKKLGRYIKHKNKDAMSDCNLIAVLYGNRDIDDWEDLYKDKLDWDEAMVDYVWVDEDKCCEVFDDCDEDGNEIKKTSGSGGSGRFP